MMWMCVKLNQPEKRVPTKKRVKRDTIFLNSIILSIIILIYETSSSSLLLYHLRMNPLLIFPPPPLILPSSHKNNYTTVLYCLTHTKIYNLDSHSCLMISFVNFFNNRVVGVVFLNVVGCPITSSVIIIVAQHSEKLLQCSDYL